MGESVLESLHSNTSVKWIFPDTEEEAEEGVEAGKYYAAIVITDKFTYSMYNAFSDDFENPALIYYQNQKSNAIATKITDTVAGTLQNTINETFIKVAATTIFEESNSVSAQVQGGSSSYSFSRFPSEGLSRQSSYCPHAHTYRFRRRRSLAPSARSAS